MWTRTNPSITSSVRVISQRSGCRRNLASMGGGAGCRRGLPGQNRRRGVVGTALIEASVAERTAPGNVVAVRWRRVRLTLVVPDGRAGALLPLVVGLLRARLRQTPAHYVAGGHDGNVEPRLSRS